MTVTLPSHVFKRWDRIALLQLAEAAARLHAENEELRRRCDRAEETANNCWEQAMDLQLRLCEVKNSEPGITQDCELVFVDRQLSIPLELRA